MAKIKAACTWGVGPDIMLIIEDGRFILYEKPQHNPPPRGDYVYGYVTKGSTDLTIEEAKQLVSDLNEAIKQTEDIEKEYCKQSQE